MDVTIENFGETLPIVERAIEEATFVSIDGEFTGLTSGEQGTGQNAMDTPAERYEKVKMTTTKFMLIQFGLCTFHVDPGTGKVTNRGFNFYVWPRPAGRMYPDPRFTVQTSSIDFLVGQGFDFNKLFKEGISYLRASDEDRIRDSVKERQAQRQANDSEDAAASATGVTPSPSQRGQIPIPEDQQQFMDDMFKLVDDWIKDTGQAGQQHHLDLPQCNPFQRRLLYSHVRPRFPEASLFLETVLMPAPSKDRFIRVSRVDAQEQARLAAAKDAAELEEVAAAAGFTRVVRKLCTSKKLVVGHNMLLDLCHTINQFVAPLPNTLPEFKDLMSSHMPNIVDTKLMASTPPLKEDIPRSTLEEMVKTLSEKPFRMPQVTPAAPDAGYSLSDSAERYHEAGYDAFVTGVCFLAMANRMGALAASAAPSKAARTEAAADPLAFTAPFRNKVCLRIPDVPYLNLSGEDIDPVRDHVFHVHFPPEWKTSDLQQLFSAFGPVQISWLGDTSAYVALREHLQNSKMVMPSLNCSDAYCIMPYSQHKALATGITPTLEKARITFTAPTTNRNGGGGVKRSVAALDGQAVVSKKRNKSTADTDDEEKKQPAATFEQPPWE